jgi:hypothetical protein
MRKLVKRTMAALTAVVLAVPVSLWGEEAGYCRDYRQVASNATGGDWVAGRLMYETMGAVERTTEEVTVTTTTTTSAGVNTRVVSASGTTTTSTTTKNETTTTTTEEPVGYYAMNDGSVYQINCITGESKLFAPGPGFSW